ncbi:unnamed protein product [Sphagnum compactum]
MSPRDVASRSLCFLALFAVRRLLLRPQRTRLSSLSAALHCASLLRGFSDILVAGILSGHGDVPPTSLDDRKYVHNSSALRRFCVAVMGTVDNTPSGPVQKSPQL